MSLNPIESVAKAVNTLLTALKLPDESAKANGVLASMDFPQFSRVLPYKDYDSETGLFINQKTVGFILEARPLPGANEHIVGSLENLLRTKLPRNVPVTINLVSSKLVGDDIEYGLREFSWSGPQAEKFNAITRAYYVRAAEKHFALPPGMDLPLTLRNYRVFISCSMPRKKNSNAQIIELQNQVKIIRASLLGAQIPTKALDEKGLVEMVSELINPNPGEMYRRPKKLDPYQELNYQCVDDSFDMEVMANHLNIGLLDKNGVERHTRVFDMGDGYKSLCENMGGVYLDGDTLKFNPFANVLDDNNFDASAERIRDQLSVMASPNGNLDEVHEGLLLQAVKAAWLTKHNKARIDDVVDFLQEAKDSETYADSPTIRSRLDEMIILLDQYTVNGIYGSYFNSDEPSLNDDARMVVLELGGLESRPSLLVAVMFSLIIYIENRMYQTPRNLKKLNVIDEGWRLLDFKNEKVGTFIEKGYRTARRHLGSYITITQNIVDFDSDTASSAARAAWGNSSYKIILKQSAKEFAKYNQLYPDQFTQLQRDMINRFGSAKDQWFSSFMLSVEAHSSWHRLFVDPLSRAMYSSSGADFNPLAE